MPIKQKKQILLETARLLSKPGCWLKGSYRSWRTTEHGTSYPCWCVTGALAYAAGVEVGAVEGNDTGRHYNDQEYEAHKAFMALDEVVNKGKSGFLKRTVFGWNDEQESVKSVIAALRKAAKL